MTRARAFVLLFSLIAASSFGGTYHGTFSLTYDYLVSETSSNVMGVSPGDTFTGWYKYISPIQDYDSSSDPWSEINLRGGMLLPNALAGPFASPGDQEVLFNGAQASLRASGGQISLFAWGMDFDATGANIYTKSFNMGGLTNEGLYFKASGQVKFGAVVVSDSSATVALLMLGLTGLGAVTAYVNRRKSKE